MPRDHTDGKLPVNLIDLSKGKTLKARGVYKQWTGLLEWWNSGMVD